MALPTRLTCGLLVVRVPRVSSRFGPVRQLGYVVRDLDRALEGWLAAGVGPWYVLDPLAVERFQYRGGASMVPDVAIALSYSGELQVELIQQRDDTPTLYRDFLAISAEGGLQHLGFIPADYDAVLASALAEGWEVGHEGAAPGARFTYLERGNHPGTVVELIDLDDAMQGFMAHIAADAAGWDGHTGGIRRVGSRRRGSERP